MLVGYSKKLIREFGSINLLELSKNVAETDGGMILDVENLFLSILPRVRLGADFQTFPDISGHPASRFAPRRVSRHFQTHDDSIVVKRKT